jgi:hypothetical protein
MVVFYIFMDSILFCHKKATGQNRMDFFGRHYRNIKSANYISEKNQDGFVTHSNDVSTVFRRGIFPVDMKGKLKALTNHQRVKEKALQAAFDHT